MFEGLTSRSCQTGCSSRSFEQFVNGKPIRTWHKAEAALQQEVAAMGLTAHEVQGSSPWHTEWQKTVITRMYKERDDRYGTASIVFWRESCRVLSLVPF